MLMMEMQRLLSRWVLLLQVQRWWVDRELLLGSLQALAELKLKLERYTYDVCLIQVEPPTPVSS